MTHSHCATGPSSAAIRACNTCQAAGTRKRLVVGSQARGNWQNNKERVKSVREMSGNVCINDSTWERWLKMGFQRAMRVQTRGVNRCSKGNSERGGINTRNAGVAASVGATQVTKRQGELRISKAYMKCEDTQSLSHSTVDIMASIINFLANHSNSYRLVLFDNAMHLAKPAVHW